MTLNPHIFREFSIRGIAQSDLTDETVSLIGRAIGLYLTRRGKLSVMVGHDARLSSPRVSRALVAGLAQSGLAVSDMGMVPTPVLNFTVDYLAGDAGIMITASHNPPEYNGLKIRTEETLHGPAMQEIYELALELANSSEADVPAPAPPAAQINPLPDYLSELKKLANTPLTFQRRPIKVVVDGGNGTNGLLVAQLLRDLGCQVFELYCEPDGNFPNRSPDPTAKGALNELAKAVKGNQADLGLAFDGDGDRVALVDEQGKVILGDQIMMLLAREALRSGPAKIVYEILCTQALADDVTAHGGQPVMTPSGYAYVHRAMLETGAAVGGELSGHLFFNDPNFRFDDAILGAIKILNLLSQSEAPLSQRVAQLPRYHSSPELRLPCPDALKASVVSYIQNYFSGDYQVDTLDGARIHFPDGWALVRQSNTQPVMSMRFEARTAEALEAIQNRVRGLVEAEIERESAL